LAKNPIFQFLFENYISSGAMGEFMESDKTLSKHPEDFKETTREILRLWDSKINL